MPSSAWKEECRKDRDLEFLVWRRPPNPSLASKWASVHFLGRPQRSFSILETVYSAADIKKRAIWGTEGLHDPPFCRGWAVPSHRTPRQTRVKSSRRQRTRRNWVFGGHPANRVALLVFGECFEVQDNKFCLKRPRSTPFGREVATMRSFMGTSTLRSNSSPVLLTAAAARLLVQCVFMG